MQSKDKEKKKRRRKEQEYIKPPPNADHRTLKKPNINAVKREITRNEEKKKINRFGSDALNRMTYLTRWIQFFNHNFAPCVR